MRAAALTSFRPTGERRGAPELPVHNICRYCGAYSMRFTIDRSEHDDEPSCWQITSNIAQITQSARARAKFRGSYKQQQGN